MGALSSFTKWIPEDDLLLKNAVEAGASLESLAKGAVRFSRRFTIRELQERWHSLLYDLDTSAEASARIIEIEIELAVPNPPKANRACNFKGKESPYGKRKVDSVRSHYHAMRKRIHSEPCSSADLGFLVPPTSHAGTGSDGGSADQLKPQNEHPVDEFALQASLLNDYGHPETSCGSGQHSFPETVRVNSASAANDDIAHHAFHTEHMGPVEDELPNGIGSGACLYGYAENISSASVDEAGHYNGNQSFEHNHLQKDCPRILGENHISPRTLDGQETRLPQPFTATNPYDIEHIRAKTLTSFDSSNDNQEILCSDFVRNDNLSLQVPVCNDSFHQLGYSSLPPDLPIWKTVEDISSPNMPTDGHFKDKDQDTLNMDDMKKMEIPGCDDVTSESKLNDGICSAGLSNPAIISESDFMDFSASYMEFADDEDLLLIHVDEKDISDRSSLNGLSSILLSSPCSAHQDGVDNSGDHRETEALEEGLVNPATSSGESHVHCNQMHSGVDNDRGPVSGPSMPSTSSETSQAAEPLPDFTICVLNTEDPEIPCNDDVIFPAQAFTPFSSNLEQNFGEDTGLLSAKLLSNNMKAAERELIVREEDKVATALVLPKLGSLHTSDGYAMEAESSDSDPIVGLSRHVSNALDDPNSCSSAADALHCAPCAALKEKSNARCFGKPSGPDASGESLLENPILQGSDHAKVYSLKVGDSYKTAANIQATNLMCLPSHGDLNSAEMGFSDPVAILPSSDQEDQFSDSENDIPNFSDIESMILDMDLGPYDQESCLFSKEVSRYQCADTKKAIVRLEQGAHSYMNRAISSHGAFAVFYGRHLKYFIKSPEVTLGRATEDVIVDIDLGREGRANKISRRQAIIKMDDDGLFFLKNTSKFSIFVNSREVPAKKRINILSGSLVEIKDMCFIFEVNERAVRRYITTLRASSHEQIAKFDWVPDQNP